MSEERARYDTGGSTLPPGTLLRCTDPNYTTPTPEDVRTLKAISGLTGRELCALVGLEDARTWRRWSQDAGAAQARQIPYSAWRLLLFELGIVHDSGIDNL
ncbi:MAG: hypothetical protein Hals2KO_21730 [Halioglobus sp.]